MVKYKTTPSVVTAYNHIVSEPVRRTNKSTGASGQIGYLINMFKAGQRSQTLDTLPIIQSLCLNLNSKQHWLTQQSVSNKDVCMHL